MPAGSVRSAAAQAPADDMAGRYACMGRMMGDTGLGYPLVIDGALTRGVQF